MMRRCVFGVCFLATICMLTAGPALAKDRIRARDCSNPVTIAANCEAQLTKIAENRAECLLRIGNNAAEQIEALIALEQWDEAAACASAALAKISSVAEDGVKKIEDAAKACETYLDSIGEEDLADQVWEARLDPIQTIRDAEEDAEALIPDVVPPTM